MVPSARYGTTEGRCWFPWVLQGLQVLDPMAGAKADGVSGFMKGAVRTAPLSVLVHVSPAQMVAKAHSSDAKPSFSHRIPVRPMKTRPWPVTVQAR